MAAPVIEAADCTVSGSNTAAATWAVSHPAASAGDLLIWNIAWDDSTDTTDVAEPAGPNSEVLSEINATPVASNGTEVRGKCWYTICTGAWSGGTLTFTPTATESWTATVIRVPAGEFDPADPIGNVLTRSSANTTDTTVENPVGDLSANDGTGTLVWFAFVDADSLIWTNPTGWTIRQAQDLGAVAHGVATRDTQTTNGETVAETTWDIAGDSWGGISYVVRGPPLFPFVGTIRFVGQTPVVGYTSSASPTVGVVRFVGEQPTVSTTAAQSVAPSVGTLRFGGYAPVLSATAHQWTVPSAGALRFVGQQPTLIEGGDKTTAPQSGVLRFVGNTPIASMPRERVGGDDLPPGWNKRRAKLKLKRELEYTEQIRDIYRALTGSPQAAEAEAILAPVVPPVAATGESEDARFAAIEARAEALRVRADRLDYDAVQAEIALRLLYQRWRQQMEDDDVAAMELLLSHVL